MTHKLKGYVSSRILEALKWKTSPNNFMPTLLSNHITIGKEKNGTNIEFHLSRTSLKKVLSTSFSDKEVNMSEVKNVVADDIICDVHEEVTKRDVSIVFQINRNMFIKEVLQDITCDTVMWRKTLAQNLLPQSKENKVVIEYSSPNIAKPFHMGHLRSTIIGNFIANLLEFLSHKVVRLNYLGDWGTQFGLLQVGLEMCGYSETLIKQNPMQLLYKAYVEANKKAETDSSISAKAREAFHCLEEGNTENMEKWKLFRYYTEQELRHVYQRLGICFDEYKWESEYSAKDIGSILHSLEARGILKTESDGRQVVEINQQWRVPIMKSDGSTLYLTRDIAAALDRYDHHKFTEMLYVVDNAQTDHFTALFGILSNMQLPWAASLKHVKFGRIRGMSTRKGSVVFLTDILDEVRDIMAKKQQESRTTKVFLDKNEKTTDILGTSAVIINDLKQRRQRDYEFDWNRALQVKYNSAR
ncbi:probable arginine--tRNA ligase, mitochondrial isoform X2 [Zootermopsis nevadensis]|uniref:probable arginine--tRNA ligase, mitochondrial isoform X2 n=1 Tax=Zootermopsis nevadensis TaxID=136037 RepID=UPI000B8E3AE1|nr:probable arginine--tRNA ligase, mitochondrial isoform X2 [Zootermopsis nevadensis]